MPPKKTARDAGRESPESQEGDLQQAELQHLQEQLRLATLESEMASKRAAEAETQRDAALQKAEEAKLQRDSIEGDQRRQDAVQNGIDQWQQRPSAFQSAGLPVAEPAPVHKALTDAPLAVAPEQMLSGTRPAPPLSPRDVITQHYDGGARSSVPLRRQSVFDGKGSWATFIRPFSSLAHTCGWNSDKVVSLVKCFAWRCSGIRFLSADTGRGRLL